MNSNPSSNSLSLFATPAELTVRSLSDFAIAPVLVVAPHPDDETLGCGGAIALLRELGVSVRVLVASDGTKSHPNSRRYPAPKLRQLRETETAIAMEQLGVEAENITFLRLPDGAVSATPAAIALCQAYLTEFPPRTLFLPYQFDPHPDHRATWQLLHGAIANYSSPPRCLEYPIWDWDPAQRGTFEGSEYRVWRLDIADKVALKKDAIAAYRSQTTNLIDDDPEGFRLAPELIANFTQPWEFFLERITDS